MLKNWALRNKTALLVAGIAVLVSVAVIVDLLPKREEPYENSAVAMGSALTVRLYGAEKETADEIYKSVVALENRISCKIAATPISALNRAGTLQADAELAAMLLEMQALCRATDGMFDITVGALVNLWDVGGANERVPAETEIRAALALTGSDRIQIDGTRITLPVGMQLDLGAAGKGMACDEALNVLQQTPSCTGAVISSGGSVLLYGKNPRADTWTVGIRDPWGADSDLIATLKLAGGFVSTSGNYEKYMIKDGKRYCHILSPTDGTPADTGLASVTVVADSGLLSDALSTACFLLGYENSLSVLQRFSAQAVFIAEDGTITATEGLQCALTVADRASK